MLAILLHYSNIHLLCRTFLPCNPFYFYSWYHYFRSLSGLLQPCEYLRSSYYILHSSLTRGFIEPWQFIGTASPYWRWSFFRRARYRDTVPRPFSIFTSGTHYLFFSANSCSFTIFNDPEFTKSLDTSGILIPGGEGASSLRGVDPACASVWQDGDRK